MTEPNWSTDSDYRKVFSATSVFFLANSDYYRRSISLDPPPYGISSCPSSEYGSQSPTQSLHEFQITGSDSRSPSPSHTVTSLSVSHDDHESLSRPSSPNEPISRNDQAKNTASNCGRVCVPASSRSKFQSILGHFKDIHSKSQHDSEPQRGRNVEKSSALNKFNGLLHLDDDKSSLARDGWKEFKKGLVFLLPCFRTT
jgi:hypothetical protein